MKAEIKGNKLTVTARGDDGKAFSSAMHELYRAGCLEFINTTFEPCGTTIEVGFWPGFGCEMNSKEELKPDEERIEFVCRYIEPDNQHSKNNVGTTVIINALDGLYYVTKSGFWSPFTFSSATKETVIASTHPKFKKFVECEISRHERSKGGQIDPTKIKSDNEEELKMCNCKKSVANVVPWGLSNGVSFTVLVHDDRSICIVGVEDSARDEILKKAHCEGSNVYDALVKEAHAKAEEIISNAKEKANKYSIETHVKLTQDIAYARDEAQSIIEDAKKEAEKIRREACNITINVTGTTGSVVEDINNALAEKLGIKHRI